MHSSSLVGYIPCWTRENEELGGYLRGPLPGMEAGNGEPGEWGEREVRGEGGYGMPKGPYFVKQGTPEKMPGAPGKIPYTLSSTQ